MGDRESASSLMMVWWLNGGALGTATPYPQSRSRNAAYAENGLCPA